MGKAIVVGVVLGIFATALLLGVAQTLIEMGRKNKKDKKGGE